jgi:hypothetical protein
VVHQRRTSLCVLGAVAILAGFGAPPANAQSSLSPGYAAADARYTPSERVGREIWFFATAFNDRFFTYSYPQRLGAVIDWYLVLGAQNKKDLFQAWGAIPDPDCCVPGDANCPARSLDETYGFQWSPGDDELLEYSSRRAIAVQFPNPRFDPEAWIELNGAPASWDGYREMLAGDPENPGAGVDGHQRSRRFHHRCSGPIQRRAGDPVCGLRTELFHRPLDFRRARNPELDADHHGSEPLRSSAEQYVGLNHIAGFPGWRKVAFLR